MNVGILGCGNIAGTMAETIREIDGITLYGVASRSMKKAEEFKNEFGAVVAYDSYEKLVKDENIELVYVATPHSFHYEHSMLALNNNKNVLCEKPFAINEQQAREMIEKAENKNFFIGEAMWTRFMPLTKKLKNLVDKKVVGEPVSIRADLSFNNMGNERMHKPELAGGALLDLGIYPLTIASIVFGNDIKKITAEGILTDLKVDKIGQYIFNYNDEKMATLSSSMCSFSDGKAVINCEGGFIIVNGINLLYSIEVYDDCWNQIAVYDKEEQITGYEYEVIAAAKAIKNNKKECPEMPHSETLAIMHQMDEIRQKLGVKYPGE